MRGRALLPQLVFGFVLWSAGFVAIYGLNAVGCAFGWPAGNQRAALALLAVAHVLALGAWMVWTGRGARRNGTAMNTMIAAAAVAALIVAALNFIPPLFLTLCQ